MKPEKMMDMRSAKVLAIALCAGLVLLTTGCAKLQSRDQMNQGVQSYKNNKYADAVKHFKQAVQLDPTNQNAQLYLATSYMIQWVPGVDSPDNKKNYDAAKTGDSEGAADRDPKNATCACFYGVDGLQFCAGRRTEQDAEDGVPARCGEMESAPARG